jgi:peptide/nickel transport system substrate-binding protein
MKHYQPLSVLPILCLITALAGCTSAGPSVPASPPGTASTTLSPTGERAGQAGETPPPGGKLVYGLTLSPSGIDPHVNASSELGIPLRSVYDSLVYRALGGSSNNSQQFVPGLAKVWQISPDGLTYTFHLRHDVTFHDGTPFNAEAVRANLERVADPATMSQKAIFLLGPFKSAEVLDEYTVAIHLSAPYAPLLDGLSQVYLGMASPKALAQWGVDYQFHQVGSGPFRFVEYVPNDHLTIVRNEDYRWGPATQDHAGPAYLEQVEFRFFTDPAGRATALEAGDVDVMGELPPLDAARLRKDSRFVIIPVPVPGQSLGMILNTQRPPLDDIRVRRALLLATDRDAIVKAVFGGQSPVADGPLTAATFGYTATLAGHIRYQPDEAGRLLQEAGYVDSDGDGVRDRDGQPLALDAVLMSWGSVPEVAQLLQSQWKEVGITLRTQTLTYPAALEAVRQGAYHLIPQNYAGSDPDLLYTYYHSGVPFNWSRASDAALDDLLDRARQETAPDGRAALYAQAQQRVLDLALLIPIRDPVNLNAASARVHGLRFDAQGWFPILHDVSLGAGSQESGVRLASFPRTPASRMAYVIARRLLTTLIALWGVATIVFILLRVLPGDPAEALLAGSGASEAAIARARAQMGLDDPLPIQYGRYLWATMRGDLGRSLFSNRPVILTLTEQLPATAELAAAALCVTVVVGLGLGLLTALRAGSWVDRLAIGGAVLGVSVPIFWSGLLLTWLFSLVLGWLPATGAGDWRHLVMPAALLGFVGAAPLARLVRANMLSVLQADYVTVARAKGLPGRTLIRRHALRNAILPAINLIGLQAGFLLGGTVVTESVFARPGLGRVVVDAILWKDLPVIQGAVLLIAAIYVLINLTVDIAGTLLDPRLRQADH